LSHSPHKIEKSKDSKTFKLLKQNSAMFIPSRSACTTPLFAAASLLFLQVAHSTDTSLETVPVPHVSIYMLCPHPNDDAFDVESINLSKEMERYYATNIIFPNAKNVRLDVTAETEDCPAADGGVQIRLESDGYVDFTEPAPTQDELQALVTSKSLEEYFASLCPEPLSVWQASIQEPNATTTTTEDDWNSSEFWSTQFCEFGTVKEAGIAAASIAGIALLILVLLCCCAYCLFSTLTCGCCT
jgi:hypothetical protein